MKKTWTEPLVLELIERHGGRRPEEIIERHAAKLLRKAEQRSLPVDVGLIASVWGVRKREGIYDFAGRIYVEPSGQLVMDVNSSDTEGRQRFTCAHELIHPAFPGFREQTRYRVDGIIEENPPNREEEYLCDLGAAALLMPEQLVRGEYSIVEGIQALERLASDARVSCEAAGNRLVSLADQPAAFLVFKQSHKPADRTSLRRGEDVPERLRLRYARSADLNVFLPRFKSARDDSILVAAAEGHDVKRGAEALPGAETAGLFAIEAKAYGTGEQRRVLAIARPIAAA